MHEEYTLKHTDLDEPIHPRVAYWLDTLRLNNVIDWTGSCQIDFQITNCQQYSNQCQVEFELRSTPIVIYRKFVSVDTRSSIPQWRTKWPKLLVDYSRPREAASRPLLN